MMFSQPYKKIENIKNHFNCIAHYSSPWPNAGDPNGKGFILSPKGKGAIAIFLFAATWWVDEVVPIGVTRLAIGFLQILFMIRTANKALTDFMDPNVLFIFDSIDDHDHFHHERGRHALSAHSGGLTQCHSENGGNTR